MAHHALDEAWTRRAGAHDAGERRIERPSARAIWIGRVEDDEVGFAPERSGSGGEATDMGRVLGAFEEVAGRVVAAMQKQVCRGHLRGKSAR